MAAKTSLSPFDSLPAAESTDAEMRSHIHFFIGQYHIADRELCGAGRLEGIWMDDYDIPVSLEVIEVKS